MVIFGDAICDTVKSRPRVCLIEHGSEVETRTNTSATPLYLAARKGHVEVVQFLIEQIADVNACCTDGANCLLTAAFNGHTAIVHVLVSAGADVNCQRNDMTGFLLSAWLVRKDTLTV